MSNSASMIHADTESEENIDLTTRTVYMICGLQGGGKSHLIKYLMYRARKLFDVVLVFSQTAFNEDNFQYVWREKWVKRRYDPAVLRGFMDVMAEMKEKGTPLNSCVIFDDCITGNQWDDEALTELITQVRHYNCAVIMSTQYPVAIRPMMHANTWRAFMFRMEHERAIGGLYRGYGQMFDSVKAFKNFYQSMTTQPHSFLEFNVKGGGTSVDSRYRKLIAPAEIPEFFIGQRDPDTPAGKKQAAKWARKRETAERATAKKNDGAAEKLHAQDPH